MSLFTVTSESILPGFSLGLLGCVARTTINVREGFPVCVYCMVFPPHSVRRYLLRKGKIIFKQYAFCI